MPNALINFKQILGSIATFLKNVRLMLAYALINQHLGSLFSQPSQNRILMVDKDAFLVVSKKTNLYVGREPGSNSVTVQVMRGRQAPEQVMHRFFWEKLGREMQRSGIERHGFA